MYKFMLVDVKLGYNYVEVCIKTNVFVNLFACSQAHSIVTQSSNIINLPIDNMLN